MEKRNYKIYAVDFDGTLCEDAWPEIGKPNNALINRMIKLREEGNKVILWTCRIDDKLTNAVDWCKEHGLEFDAINENVPEILETFGAEARKIYADVYVDDRAVDLGVMMFFLGACSINSASAEQIWPLKIWHQNDNGAMHTYCVVDDDTGVNYVVVSTERGNGEYSIAITPRLNADGSLYVKE